MFKFDIFLVHFLAKKVIFLVSRGVNEISLFLPPLVENLFGPTPGKNLSDAHGCFYTTFSTTDVKTC